MYRVEIKLENKAPKCEIMPVKFTKVESFLFKMFLSTILKENKKHKQNDQGKK